MVSFLTFLMQSFKLSGLGVMADLENVWPWILSVQRRGAQADPNCSLFKVWLAFRKKTVQSIAAGYFPCRDTLPRLLSQLEVDLWLNVTAGSVRSLRLPCHMAWTNSNGWNGHVLTQAWKLRVGLLGDPERFQKENEKEQIENSRTERVRQLYNYSTETLLNTNDI